MVDGTGTVHRFNEAPVVQNVPVDRFRPEPLHDVGRSLGSGERLDMSAFVHEETYHFSPDDPRATGDQNRQESTLRTIAPNARTYPHPEAIVIATASHITH